MLGGGWAAPCPDTLGRLACKVLSEFERKKPPIILEELGMEERPSE